MKDLNQTEISATLSGIDLIKHTDSNYYILEDNLRMPSGRVSYVLENREIMKRSFPELFEDVKIQTVSNYPVRLYEILQYISGKSDVQAVLLNNSAYFEHSFLAKKMGIELLEGKDLFVDNSYVS